jgi:hypothetical protein
MIPAQTDQQLAIAALTAQRADPARVRYGIDPTQSLPDRQAQQRKTQASIDNDHARNARNTENN